MNDAWRKFSGDFNSMLDNEIENEVREIQGQVDVGEEWIEAVASWKAAGRPREGRRPITATTN